MNRLPVPRHPHCRPGRLGWATLALTSALLAACGGADDAPPTPPPPPPPAVPAPSITTAPATVTVGEGDAAQFAVSASGTGPLSYQWALDGSGPISGATTATLDLPRLQLQDNGKRFGVTVGNTAGSVTSPLATLNVTERTWSVLALLPSGAAGTEAAQTQRAPAMVVDSNGHTHAVFSQKEANGGDAMWAAYKPAGAANFTSFTRLTAAAAPVAANSFAVEPVVAADADGRVFAAWRSSRLDDTSQVLAAAYLPSSSTTGAWGAQQTASDPALFTVNELAVAPAGSGTFEVVYAARSTAQSPNDIVARRVTVSGSTLAWANEVVLDDSTANVINVKVAGNAAGQVIATWFHGAQLTETRGTVRSGSTAWSAAFNIGELANENVQPAGVVIDAQGRGVVAMFGDQTRVYVRRFAFNANGFGLAGDSQYVSNATDYAAPVVAAGPGGTFELVSLHNLGRQISRTRFNGASWSALDVVHLVDSPEAVDVIYALQAGVDGAGNLIVSWAHRTDPNSWPIQRARRFHAGLAQWRDMAEFFSTERVRGSGGTALAVQTDGSALALVMRGDGAVGQAVFK